ncbi:MAG: MotA/TolQ/ExbB proton channel family protein [Planctomycetes bacterium]|nr:MotA/TolQ/ExbB proton channel family protein [Planctomycetota bacterium]
MPLIDTIYTTYHSGGVTIVIIFALSLIMWFLILERFWHLQSTGLSSNLSICHDSLKGKGVLGRIVAIIYPMSQDERAKALDEAILAETYALKRFEGSIAVLAATLPLLGLIGTVSGMITMFDAFSLSGMKDGRQVSQGISQALLTTQAGLLTSLPGVFAYQKICKMRGSIEHGFGVLRLMCKESHS